jgi:AcrR family transcriptional regulator
MSPRGSAIPSLHQQLFEATDRLLRRDGPNGITTRAITDEAGCAKGILHNHFQDLDGFLVAYARDRIDALSARVQTLPARAGERTVVENLTTAIVDVFGSGAALVANLMAARPTLQGTLRESPSGGDPIFDDIQRAIAAYLAAEARLGRLHAAGVDMDILAFAVVGACHHLFFASGLEPIEPKSVRRIVKALLPGPGGSTRKPAARRRSE